MISIENSISNITYLKKCQNYTFPPYQPQSRRIPISYSANRTFLVTWSHWLVAWLPGHIRIEFESTVTSFCDEDCNLVTSGLNLDTWYAGPVNSICVGHLQKRLSLKSLEDKTTKYNSSFSDAERPVSTNWSPCLLYKYKDNFNPHKTFPFLYKDKFQLHKVFWFISPALSKQLWVFHILWALSSSLVSLVLLLLIWSNNNLPTWHKIS